MVEAAVEAEDMEVVDTAEEDMVGVTEEVVEGMAAAHV